MTTKHVGDLIREARESVNVSQRGLVEAVDQIFGKTRSNRVSRRHLSNVELGTSNMSINKLNLVTFALLKLGAK